MTKWFFGKEFLQKNIKANFKPIQFKNNNFNTAVIKSSKNGKKIVTCIDDIKRLDELYGTGELK